MNELLILLTVIVVLASALATLREILGDNPRRHRPAQPPRSHPADPFGRSGHSFR